MYVPVELGSRDHSSAAKMIQSWCESARGTVPLMDPSQTQRDRQTVQTQQLGLQCSPVGRLNKDSCD